MIKKYFLEFFEGWLNLPKYSRLKGHPLYVTGESYAGHYIPQVGNALYMSNNPDINLQGLAIGNGWVNPIPQNTEYITYTSLNNETHFNGTYTKEEEIKDTKLTQLCNYGIKRMNPYHAYDQGDACDDSSPHMMGGQGGVNYYDIRIKCEGELCYNFKYMHEFFNDPKTKKAMGVENYQGDYQLCSGRVAAALSPQDYLTNSILELAPVIEGGVKILFYTGEMDYICNWKGTQKFLSEFQWSGRTAWNKRVLVKSKYGMEKSYLNLRFIKFKDSGHMVPHDQPELALEMLNEFIGVEK